MLVSSSEAGKDLENTEFNPELHNHEGHVVMVINLAEKLIENHRTISGTVTQKREVSSYLDSNLLFV